MSMERTRSSTSLLSRLQTLFAGLTRRAPNPLRLHTTACSTFDEFAAYYARTATTFAARFEHEHALIINDTAFTTEGYCFPCHKHVAFKTDFLYSSDEKINDKIIPNWRERVICPECGLNNRIRASVQFLEEILGSTPCASIYMSEQTTPLYHYLKARYPNLTGSEYLGERIAFGTVDAESGLRNESITKLSFADEAFDFVLSFDVLEHIPEYAKALKECLRVLRPGGRLLFTVPFRLDNTANLVRATIDSDGSVVHLMEPEYHGDPISDQGCLCFYHFGWQLLDELRAEGFASATAHLYWADTLGYLGQHQLLLCAEKAGLT